MSSSAEVIKYELRLLVDNHELNILPSEEQPLKVQGYGAPLNQRKGQFENAVLGWEGTPIVVRERKMIAMMNEITDKPDWQQKLSREEVVRRWREEALAMDNFSEKMFDHCIYELRDTAVFEAKHGFVPAIDAGTKVYKSDTAIDQNLMMRVRQAAALLEDVPDAHKDWHPGSDGLVLDLLHPSLFPLVYGRTRILPMQTTGRENCLSLTGSGEVIPVPTEDDIRRERKPWLGPSMPQPYGHSRQKVTHYSARFQWLPADVAFNDDETVRLTSYINNLHPEKHRLMYGVIEEVIARAIPLWDAVLSTTIRSHRAGEETRIVADGDPEYRLTGSRSMEGDEDTDSDEPDWWERDDRILVQPEPGRYKARLDPLEGNDAVSLRKQWRHSGMQIIAKLANIYLTPEKPEYGGGSWHVEGMLNEHICASALYYYHSDNVTDSFLAFRETMRVDEVEDAGYSQDEYGHLEELYDIRNQGAGIQDLGHVLTREGRLLVFPNVLQHRVEGFELADRSRGGHRKLLALFLVDPHCRIPSTSNVPPQQKEWWTDLVLQAPRIAALPPELAENIMAGVEDFPYDLDEAKKLRLDLMEERSVYVKGVEHELQTEHTFNFCEH